MDDAKMFPNFNLDFFSDFITDNDITNIGDDISDGEIISCVEIIEKEQESVTNPPECRPQTLKQPESARFALLTDEDLITIISSAEAKGTKKNTIKGKYTFYKKFNKFPVECSTYTV